MADVMWFKVNALVPSVAKEECTAHSFAYRGRVPCTGPLQCTMCNGFPVYCAWCPQHGRSTVVGVSTVPDSHGICGPCSDALLDEGGEGDAG